MIWPATRGHISRNIAVANDQGLNIHGTGNVVSNNVASGNFGGGGIFIGGHRHYIKGNICNANTFTGIRVASGSDHRIEGNFAIGNGNEGVSLDAGGRATVVGNNLFGTGSNCGLRNNDNAGILAMGNFWGAATGPGANPADAVCSNGAATSNTSGFLKKAIDNPLDRDDENEGQGHGHADD